MSWRTLDGGVHILDLAEMAGLDRAAGVVSTRRGGVSEPPYTALNVGFHVGDDAADVAANRRRLYSAIGVEPAAVVTGEQVHGGAVRVVTRADAGRGSMDLDTALRETDAMVTAETGICLMVVVADCVPVLLQDPVRRVVGIAHAGWHGTANGIAESTLRTMTRAFGSKPRDVMAAFGPAICPRHYTVGAEVVEALDETRPAGLTAPYVSVGEGSYALDLWEANSARLEASGLPSNQIHVARICTFEDGDRFYSHRRSGAATGRVAACIMLRD